MAKQPVTVFYLGTKQGISDDHYLEFIKEIPGLEEMPVDQSIGYDAKLYIKRGEEKPPSWEAFLKPGFSALTLPMSRALSAVLILSQTQDGTRHWFACSFGAGRFILNQSKIQRGFGLRAALNAIYADGVPEDQNNRIRSVTSKTVSQNTLHTKQQADANALFEFFGVDSDTDFLSNVTGVPFDQSLGGMMTGADALTVRIDETINTLDALCLRLFNISSGDEYQERFDWIDKIKSVVDSQLRDDLLELVASNIRSQQVENLNLTIPKVLDWEDVDHLQASWDSDEEFEEVTLQLFIDFLEDDDKLQDLQGTHLKSKYQVFAKDSNDEILGGGSFLKCMAGEIEHAGKTYILSEGEFYEIEPDFLQDLDNEVAAIPASMADLPPSPNDPPEGEYNENAANHSTKHLLLDKKTVRVATHTSPIEVCDVLTADGQMIHVKRKLGSSSLSHLFAQGFVSSDLLVTSPEYRVACVNKINEAAEERAPGDAAYRSQFDFINSNAIDSSQVEVVYAIAAKWRDRSFVEALPFFSKVNLRRFAKDLRRLGFKVTHAQIDAD